VPSGNVLAPAVVLALIAAGFASVWAKIKVHGLSANAKSAQRKSRSGSQANNAMRFSENKLFNRSILSDTLDKLRKPRIGIGGGWQVTGEQFSIHLCHFAGAHLLLQRADTQQANDQCDQGQPAGCATPKTKASSQNSRAALGYHCGRCHSFAQATVGNGLRTGSAQAFANVVGQLTNAIV
jgi:hypothetical protein